MEPTSGDRVVVAIGAKGGLSLNVAGVFEEGQTVRDAYTGRTAKVTGGKATLLAEQYVLLERVQGGPH